MAIFDRDPATGGLEQKENEAGCISEDGTGGACEDVTALREDSSVTVSPDGKSAYVASVGSGAVAIFDRDPATGGLTQKAGKAACISEDGTGGACEDGRGLQFAFGATVSPDGASVYVASESGNVAVFDRNRTTGALTQGSGTGGCISEDGTGGTCQDGKALADARYVSVSRDGKSFYATSHNSDAIAIFDRAVPPPPPPLPLPSSADTLAPTVSHFRIAPAHFKATPKGGSNFRFTLSERAGVRIAIERVRPGRQLGKRCKATIPKLRNRPRCRRFTLAGVLSFQNSAAGANAIRFSGRIAGRALAAGAYRATIIATDAAGNRSLPQAAAFTVLAQRRPG